MNNVIDKEILGLTPMKIGDRVKKAREDAGMTQEILASISGVPQARISALELNKHKKSSYLIQLSTGLGVDPNWLLTGVSSGEVKVDYTPIEKEILSLTMQLTPEQRVRQIAYMRELVRENSKL
jgi:transcriptional regulator with XRE-family HTH domain|tara:strand:- start:115 stop:486 length:372 start_codon:yes stop_codon:yes gene_type:complete